MNDLKGTGIFVCSDPGAAKGVLAFAQSLIPSLQNIFAFSDRSYPFFNEFNIAIQSMDQDPQALMDIIKPDFIFTGTSYTSDIELRFIAAAKKNGIRTIAFIDHWTSFKRRFQFGNSLLFPDTILVIDQRAKELAIAEGLPEDKLFIFGNPYLTYLKTWKPTTSRNNLLDQLGTPISSGKLVVFAPEPLSNVGGMQTYGFDETTVARDIDDILKQKNYRFSFVLKMHPNQNRTKLEQLHSKHIIFTDDRIDTKTLMYYADLIIGFFSNFLIEAAVFGKPVLRLHTIPVKQDPLDPLNIGKVVDRAQLIQELDDLNETR